MHKVTKTIKKAASKVPGIAVGGAAVLLGGATLYYILKRTSEGKDIVPDAIADFISNPFGLAGKPTIDTPNGTYNFPSDMGVSYIRGQDGSTQYTQTLNPNRQWELPGGQVATAFDAIGNNALPIVAAGVGSYAAYNLIKAGSARLARTGASSVSVPTVSQAGARIASGLPEAASVIFSKASKVFDPITKFVTTGAKGAGRVLPVLGTLPMLFGMVPVVNQILNNQVPNPYVPRLEGYPLLTPENDWLGILDTLPQGVIT